MKKKMLLFAAVCMAAFMVTACGSKDNAKNDTTAAVETTAASETTSEAGETESSQDAAETTAAETTKVDLSNVDPQEAAGPGAADGAVAEEENKNFEDLENSDYKAFAGQVKEAVAAKDMDALADLMHFPSYVAIAEENEGVVNTREEFMALDPESVFEQAMVDAIANAGVEGLEPSMAGVVLGEDTPNIIINSSEGKLGIVGMNY